MDYRDRNGYFQEDVLQVLGRSGILGSSGGSVASSIHGSIDQGHLHQQYAAPEPLIYQALKDGNFSDSDLTLSNVFSSSDSSSTTSNTTESTCDVVNMD
ncbi:hypothetical protein FB639_000300 [Coemansia asiatica]|nr:hypothetical protein FB639_000300 [Coemansia asiatica]